VPPAVLVSPDGNETDHEYVVPDGIVPVEGVYDKLDPLHTFVLRFGMTGLGFIVIDLFVVVIQPGLLPVVNVNVTEEGADEDAVYVAVLGVVPPLLENEPAVPPDNPSDQIADVAPPPKEPPKAAEVPF